MCKNEEIKLFEAFSGIGTQAIALKEIGANFTTVGISEIDGIAENVYKRLHGNVFNYGDIQKIDPNLLPDMNLFTYSFPCQDISVNGAGLGFEEGTNTRSSMLWECAKIIKAKKPKVLVMENVKNIVSKKHIGGFVKWLNFLEELGYTNSYSVLSGYQANIPQKRERLFLVSHLGDGEPFKFPTPKELKKNLLDFVCDLDSGYFLPKSNKEKYLFKPANTDGSLNINNCTKQGFIVGKHGDGIDLTFPSSKTKRGRVIPNKIHTLTAGYKNFGVIYNSEIKILSAKECWLLMGINENYFNQAQAICSDRQLYKLAGNAIIVDVLEMIFTEIILQFFTKEGDVNELC